VQKSWILISENSDFPLANIPYGIITTEDNSFPRLATIIGDTVIDLSQLNAMGAFEDIEGIDDFAFDSHSLNDFIAQGKGITQAVRRRIQQLFGKDHAELRDNTAVHSDIFYKASDVQLHLPIEIGDYTDFYSSRQHATNVGIMFRDPANALLPNWLHIPVGYHGRASSIVVSGTDILRPSGQRMPPGAEKPVFGASQLLDFELEMAFIIGKENRLGQPVTTAEAEDYIFGLALFNDWSARDIQAWEYVPLGPFLGKNFASSLSPWIVTLEALNEFRLAGPVQEPAVLPYLEYSGNGHYDIALEVAIQPENGEKKVVCQSNFKNMYWNMVQQLAHHTVNGCNMRIGDLCASGTISGDTPESFGSMLELTWRGANPIAMPDGSQRKFINDGDTVIMRGFAQKGDLRIGFGEVTGKIVNAMTAL
jgi:fumarylacetoacetase